MDSRNVGDPEDCCEDDFDADELGIDPEDEEDCEDDDEEE